jgi:DNA-directed RNA polymerase subunit RPC12/RpoP
MLPLSLGHFMIDENVKIKCTKCSQVFRERAQKIRNGLQTNCQHCNRLINPVVRPSA